MEKPGGVLLITPESLESLFVNRSAALSRLFHSLSFVVIDELHALLGSERGTQLRSQLFRLARYAVGHTRYVALSATIGDLDAAARWLRPDRDRLVQILKEDGAEKEVRYRIHGYRAELIRDAKDADAEPEWVPPHQMYAGLYDSFRGTKNLIFANSKSTVEELVDRLNELGSQHGTGAEFLIHHGSISKDVREETERLMQGGAALHDRLLVDAGAGDRYWQRPRRRADWANLVGQFACPTAGTERTTGWRAAPDARLRRR